MRNSLSKALVGKATDPQFVFLTGDLGFQALEPVRDALGSRFINAGVAEQNMVSVAAGLAHSGLRPWVYSIAPFVYARPFEQIRNDVCLHKLPVTLVGNGGGYAYGVMGSTHHALEDYGSLLCFAGLKAFVPVFAADVACAVDAIGALDTPCYLRLGRCEKPPYFVPPAYSPWRKLISGGGPTVAAIGPIAGELIDEFSALAFDERPRFWAVSELPVLEQDLPDEFMQDLERSDCLLAVEEHVAHGGFGQMLAHSLSSIGQMPKRFLHKPALGYVSGLYGSQAFHRRECGLDAAALVAAVLSVGQSAAGEKRPAA